MNIDTVKNLQTLIDRNSNILLIEVWDRVLYLRMKEGKNKFYSKKNITTETEGIYINLLNFKQDYKNAQRKFHPDRNEKYIKISKGLNQWKELLSQCFKREFTRTEYNLFISSYPGSTPVFSTHKSIRIALEEETGLFDGYIEIKEPTNESRAETEAWWEEEIARQCGRNKDGTKYNNPFKGDLPF